MCRTPRHWAIVAGMLAAVLLTLPALGDMPETQPAEERFMSDEEFLKIGEEFDLDAFIAELDPPTVEEIIASREPIPSVEQILDDLEHPERRPKLPTLPEDVAQQIEQLNRRIDELMRKGVMGGDAQLKEQTLDEATRMAEQEVELRTQAGQAQDWHEVVDAQLRATSLKYLRELPMSSRRKLSSADVRAIDLHRLFEQGQYDGALAIGRSQLAIRQRLFPGDHPDVATSMNNVAVILKTRGSLDEAELLIREALAMRQRLFPGDHPAVATSLGNLASPLQARGAMAEAEPLCRDALTMNQRLFSGDDPDVATSLNDLAHCLGHRGALPESEALFRDALAMKQRLFPGDHPDVAAGLSNLAAVLETSGALAEAEPLYRDALAMWQRLFPGDHPNVGIGMNNLAAILRARGALAEAEPLCRDALMMLRRCLPRDHPNVAAGLTNLARVFEARGALAEAEASYRDALAMKQRLFPGDHPGVALGMNNLAGVLWARGAPAEAELLFRDGLTMVQRVFPGDHAYVAVSLNNLALILRARGALAEAEPLCRDALTILRRCFPADEPRVAAGLNNLAHILQDRGALAEAELLFRDAFDMSERLRTQIIGGEQERAAFAGVLDLSARAHAYTNVLAQLHREAEVLKVLERGRARAALDLLERSGRDLVAETEALGDAERSRRLAEAEAAEEQARIDLTSTEALLASRRKERDTLERRENLDAQTKARQLAEYDQQIAGLLEDVKRKRQELTQAGIAVLTELRDLFPVAQALTTDEILRGLSPDEAVVSFSWGGDSILVASATGDTTGAVIVASDKDAVKQLSELAGEVREAIAIRSSAASALDPAKTRELAAALFPEPVCAAVSGVRRLVILPDGPLNDIPIEMLTESVPALADKTIVYAPSATVYVNRKTTRPQVAKATDSSRPIALLLGDPVFERGYQEPDYPEQGVLVVAAPEGGNAAKVGLRRGDVLLRYDDRELDGQAALVEALGSVNEAIAKGERPADEAVKIAYWRDGQEAEVELPPGRMGVQIQPGNPAEILRSMTRLERGFDAMAAEANALDQVRLFGGSLVPLPGTRREAEAIAALFAQAAARQAHDATFTSPAACLLLDEQATIANLSERVAGVRYLHLATHGLMGSAERPYDASLALTQPETPTAGDIGFLRLQDLISRWTGRLDNCELVVLSACDTQRGIRRGDSVMSLPLGFFFAGARTVVASLWKVDDTATALLMTRFYENLLGEFDEARDIAGRTYAAGQPMPKAAALREAKLWLRSSTNDEITELVSQLPASDDRGTVRERPPVSESAAGAHPYEHPYYWAAFILIGDPG